MTSPWSTPWQALRSQAWSPYAAGAALGVTTTLSMAVWGKRLSGAGAYQHLSGYLGRSLAPQNIYWKYVMPPAGFTWELWLLVGTFLGAFGSALASRQFRLRSMPDAQWQSVFGPSVVKRWLIVFVGTALIELAAGIAGGCTASLAVSGGAALAPGAFLFIVGMFGGGIPTARWLYRKAKRTGAAT
jgi:hypothetical protein